MVEHIQRIPESEISEQPSNITMIILILKNSNWGWNWANARIPLSVILVHQLRSKCSNYPLDPLHNCYKAVSSTPIHYSLLINILLRSKCFNRLNDSNIRINARVLNLSHDSNFKVCKWDARLAKEENDSSPTAGQ